MREAMANAEVGDDVWGDDPTVNRLQEMAAERVGKEAALFVPSGTMGNLAAALAHCGRGDELILGDKSHTFRYEAGGVAVLGGIHPCLLPNQADGTLDLADIEAAVRPDNPHFARSRAIFLENTHNICGGAVIPPNYFADVRQLADRYGLLVHLDGARVFNAAVALDCPVAEITQYVDSVTFCLSKGLCAPVGSLLCGSADFIYHAGRARKMLGGGMRQVGILAAAGIVALEQMVDRLAQDHANARQLAQGLAGIPGVEIDLAAVQTNLVFFGLAEDVPIEPADLIERLDRDYRIKIGGRGSRQFRAVTHYWISSKMVETVVDAFRSIVPSV
jgi:threonine aldolase